MLSLLVGSSGYAAPQASEITMATFDGAAGQTHKWVAQNDPVMGGQSYSTVKVENELLNFVGACKIVPSLKAPGFVKAVASDKVTWPDVSGCEGIKLTAKAADDYKGYRLSFGNAKPVGGKFFAYGYKKHFTPSVGSFGSVELPFNEFTDFWDDGTGEPIHTCAENKDYCPDMKTLRDVKTISIWAEGVEGDVDLQVKSISAYGCK
jgi:hypothetical protein